MVSILGAIARSIASKSKAWWRQRKLERTPFIVVEQTEQFSINFHKARKKSNIIVQWSDVRQVELTANRKKLILQMLNNEKMELKKNKIYYWNDVVKAVPDVILANASFIEYRFRNFSGLNKKDVLYANDSEWKPLVKANEIREFWKNPSNKDKAHDPSMQRFRKKIEKYKMVEYRKIE